MEDRYESLKNHFEGREGVTVTSGRGAQGIKANSVMFAMFYKGDLLVRLPPNRVTALIESDEALPFDPGTGAMKDRVVVSYEHQAIWQELCEESLHYIVDGKS